MPEKSVDFASSKTVRRAIARSTLHLLLGTIGIVLLSDVLIGTENSLAQIWNVSVTYKQASWLLTEIPGFPVQAAVGLLLGFVLGKYLKRRYMIWTWVLPFVFTCLILAISPFHGSSIFVHFFGTGCSPRNHCFDQFVVALPLIASSAYSLGAWLSIWTSNARKNGAKGRNIPQQV
jgi:hypothetical protein